MSNNEKIIIGTTEKKKPVYGYYFEVMKSFMDKNQEISKHSIMNCTSRNGKQIKFDMDEVIQRLLLSDLSNHKISRDTGVTRSVILRLRNGTQNIGKMRYGNVKKLYKYQCEIENKNKNLNI